MFCSISCSRHSIRTVLTRRNKIWLAFPDLRAASTLERSFSAIAATRTSLTAITFPWSASNVTTRRSSDFSSTRSLTCPALGPIRHWWTGSGSDRPTTATCCSPSCPSKRHLGSSRAFRSREATSSDLRYERFTIIRMASTASSSFRWRSDPPATSLPSDFLRILKSPVRRGWRRTFAIPAEERSSTTRCTWFTLRKVFRYPTCPKFWDSETSPRKLHRFMWTISGLLMVTRTLRVKIKRVRAKPREWKSSTQKTIYLFELEETEREICSVELSVKYPSNPFQTFFLKFISTKTKWLVLIWSSKFNIGFTGENCFYFISFLFGF